MHTFAPPSHAISSLSDLLMEERVSLKTLALELAKNEQTVRDWTNRGTRTRSIGGVRRRVVLESFQLGGVVYTTRQAFRRYMTRLNDLAPAKLASGQH